ncbi:hypothetical protein DC31_07290 [Microbacterium sp. CH12i]|uniref:hypothetical protein n=1 Tax=Microbacterium sp. CH12i TaxID=1479651 RepID=UPI000461EBD6|nr:hypothetical protein [Microbacterium sp. CH12i]KDA06916.1 hypothetical protein DC31_07290 [Microbacterium sp. CH12i]
MIPNDLQIWLELQNSKQDTPFSDDGVVFVPAGEVPASVHEGYIEPTYLSAEELKEPSIAANIHAHKDTIALITWAAVDENESAWGYWRGPEDTPITEAPIVQLDSEGTYRLLPGASLSDALAWSLDDYSHTFDEFVELCAEAGVRLSANDPGALLAPADRAGQSNPAAVHAAANKMYLAANE